MWDYGTRDPVFNPVYVSSYVIAERISARQLIMSRIRAEISTSVYICVCNSVTLQEC